MDLNQNGQLDPVYYEDSARIIALPMVDIKIIGQDNLTTVIGGSLSVTISLDPGTASNQADLFIWIETPVGILNLTTSGWRFKYGLSQISPAYQGAIGKIQDLEIISSVASSNGECTFHFAIDLYPNGALDPDRYDDVAELVIE